MEVREVSSRAAALGARLGDAAALAEPRENAFLAVDFAHNDAQQRFAESLSMLGRVRTSTTFPGLCTLQLGKLKFRLGPPVPAYPPPRGLTCFRVYYARPAEPQRPA